jgi:oligopeptide/dipeptide ABC transporter ATP-binding protein
MMAFDQSSTTSSDPPLLSVQELRTEFRVAAGAFNAADSVSFSIYPGQTLALVGESGCGKSVTAMSIMRLIAPPGYVVGGKVLLSGQDLLTLPERRMRKVRGGKIAMIFQEPMSSLNPVFTIGEQIIEAVQLHQRVSHSEAMQIAQESLKRVGIADPVRRLHDYPHQMSGGMKQRVMIAMALACRPQLLIADEPTTALDVTIQAQILELLSELQRQTNMAIMLITHDLGIVAENADVVAIMYAGQIVEFASVYELFENPLHPYTRGLLGCVPRLGSEHEILPTIPGVVPDPRDWPAGCRFEPRCTMCSDNVRWQCKKTMPLLKEVYPDHWLACFDVDTYAMALRSEPRLPFRREGKSIAPGAS